jgi:hypothetical protein
MVKSQYLIVMCLASFFVGCANNMALTKGQDSVDLSNSSIALLSVRASNQNEPSHQPLIVGAYTLRQSKTTFHRTRTAYKKEGDAFKEQWLSFELEPGINNFTKLWATCPDLVFLTSFASIPLNLDADIKPNSINYLGHLDVTIRKKNNDDEESVGSGPYVVGNAAAGFLTATYDVVVEDKIDEDIKTFIAEYPALNKVKVEKSILPQWVRPEKQRTK